MSDSKTCAKCKADKPKSEFPPGKKWRDGLHPYCWDCKRTAGREYHRRNAEAISKRKAAAYAADPARAVAEAHAWNQANPERRKAIARKYQQANLHGTVREATRRRYATRKGAPALIFSPDQLAQRSAYYGGLCWCCGVVASEWDHVIPLSKGGWHCLANLRPICRPCNATKSDRWPWPLVT